MKIKMLFRLLFVIITALCSSISTSWAASITNNGTGGNLTVGTSWLGGVAPGSADTAIWDSTVGSGFTSALGANTIWGGIRILNPSAAITISAGNTLTNGASGIDMTKATVGLTLANPTSLNGNQSWLVTNGQTLNVNGIVSGTNFLTLNGGTGTNGRINIIAANTYTGGTLLRGGVIAVSNNAAFGATGGLTNIGGTIEFGGVAGFAIANPLVVSNTAVIDNNVLNLTNGNNTLNLPLSGNGTIVISNLLGVIIGNDDSPTTPVLTLTLGASAAGQTMDNFTGKIVVSPVTSAGTPSGGNIRFNSGATVNVGSPNFSLDLGPSPSSVAVTVRNGGTVSIGELNGGPNTALIGSRSTANSVNTWSVGGMNTSTTFAGKIRDATAAAAANGRAALTKVGTGKLTLTGTNTYSGNTTFNGGLLNAGIAEAGTYGPFGEPDQAPTPNPLIGSMRFGGGALQYSSANQFDYSGRFDDGTLGNQQFSVDVNGQSVTFASALNGTGSSLTLTNSTGSGTLTLTAAATYTGKTTINRGKLALSGSAALAAVSTISIGAGGTFDVSTLSSPYTLGAGGLIGSGTGTTAGTTAATITPASGGIFDAGSQPITLNWGGGTTGTDSTHPTLVISQGTLALTGNTITILVAGAGLAPGVYTLITAPTITGSLNTAPDFTGGNGLAFGCTAILSVSGGNKVILTVSQTSLVANWNNSTLDTLWSTGNNWDQLTAPHLVGDVAVLGSAVSNLVNLDVSETIGGLAFTNTHSFTVSGANTLTMDNNNNGATFVANAGITNKISTPVSLNDNLKIQVFPNTLLNVAGVIANGTGVKTLEIAGGGTNTLENANTYGPSAGTVGTKLSGVSTLQVGTSTSLGAGDLRVVGNGTLRSGAAGLSLANNVTLDPGITATVNNNGNALTLAGVISGDTGKLTVTGSGTTSLSGAETYGGATTINSGTTLKIAGAGQLTAGTYTPTITDNGVLDYNSSLDQILSGIISGSGKIVQDGAGMLTLSAANTYSGGTTNNAGTLTLNNATGAGTGLITLNGGTMAIGAITIANAITVPGITPIISNTSGAGAQLNGAITGAGTLNVDQANAAGTLTIGTGGMTAFTGTIKVNDTSAGFMRFSGSSGSTAATFDLGNSTVQFFARSGGDNNNLGALIGGPNTQVGGSRSAAATTTFYIGGKNLSTTFRGTIVDGNFTVAQPVSIVKTGTGTLTLGGVNTYTGSTTISNGILALTNTLGSDASISTTTNISIFPGAGLSLAGLIDPTLPLITGQTLSGGGTLFGKLNASGGTINPGFNGLAGTLTITNGLAESGNVSHFMELSAVGSTNDLIAIKGNLDVSGVNTITLTKFGGGIVPPGTYPLITYTGTLTLSDLLTNVFKLVAIGFNADLTNITSVVPNQIAVNITPPIRQQTNLTWVGDGGANNWDVFNSTDWTDGISPSFFLHLDRVLFSDSGSPNTNVNLVGDLYPASILVSNATKNYTFNGGGNITGTVGLTKTNSGKLTIVNNNSYTGPTILGGGTLSVATLTDGGVPSPIGAASNNSTNLVFTGGTLDYSGSDIAINRGLNLIGTGGSIAVPTGVNLTINGLITGTGSGALTKTGLGTLTLGGASTFTNNIVVNAGILSDVNAQNVPTATVGGLGNPQNAGRSITVNSGGILSLDSVGGNDLGNGSTTVLTRFIINQGGLLQITVGNATIGPVTLNGGTLNAGPASSVGPQYGAFEFSGDITVGGSVPSTISADNNASLNLTVNTTLGSRIFNVADVTGNANSDLNVTTILHNSGNTQAAAILVKAGAGTMTLTAANTYTGGTIISNGVLVISITGSLATNTVSIRGGILAGSGTVGGAVTNQPGGTLAPGTGINTAGTVLNVADKVTLLEGSTTLMQVSHTATDKVAAIGPVIYGGILLISTNAGDATPYNIGDTFTLFNLSAGASGSFASIQPPPGPGLGWDGGNLTVDGSISVVAAGTPVVASFTGSPLSGSPALPVTFVNNSTGANYWDWNFGDGVTLSTNGSANLVHTYTSAGSYTVILKAYGLAGTSFQTNLAYVVVTNLPPVPAFVGTPTNGAAPLAVTFTNNSSGTGTSWFWSFGDGTSYTAGATTNVTHTYTNAGSYNVGLTATGPGGTVGFTNVAYIITTNSTPAALFTGTPTNIFVTQSVTFTNFSTGTSLTNWIWIFGDGTVPVTNLTGVNIAHTYSSAVSSPYTVSLTVNGAGGSSTNTRAGYIVVKPIPVIGSTTLSGTNLVLSGTNGVPGAQYRVLTSTNITTAIASWTPLVTNVFAANGSYSYTNSPVTNSARFFILVTP